MYKAQFAQYETSSFALLDLNTFKDILSVGRSNDSRGVAFKRLGAALILFFQCSDILVEPCMALHESPIDASNELNWFRRIDNANPNDLWEVATGKADFISEDRLPSIELDFRQEGLETPLKGTEALQISLLKLAELLRSSRAPKRMLEDYLRWSLEEFIFVREAVLLAIFQLTGRLQGPVLRNLRAGDPARRVNGIKNAMWDLLFVREWHARLKRQRQANELWLMCTRDQTLHRIAGALVQVDVDEEEAGERLKSLIIKNWGAHEGLKLYDIYADLACQLEDSGRGANQPGFASRWALLKSDLLNRLRT